MSNNKLKKYKNLNTAVTLFLGITIIVSQGLVTLNY